MYFLYWPETQTVARIVTGKLLISYLSRSTPRSVPLEAVWTVLPKKSWALQVDASHIVDSTHRHTD